jgi:hypothetical protein
MAGKSDIHGTDKGIVHLDEVLLSAVQQKLDYG